MIYLLCFEDASGRPSPYCHSGHYLGFTNDLDSRIVEHRSGRGARLVEVALASGLTFQVVATWEGNRNEERHMKRHGSLKRFCPRCRKEAMKARAAWKREMRVKKKAGKSVELVEIEF